MDHEEMKQVQKEMPEDTGRNDDVGGAVKELEEKFGVNAESSNDIDDQNGDRSAKRINARNKSRRTLDSRQAKQKNLEAIVTRRPLRMTVVGVVQKRNAADNKFIAAAKAKDFEVEFQQKNPKIKWNKDKDGENTTIKESWKKYEKFKLAKTLKEALQLGADMSRINDDYEKGYIKFPGRESKEPGHIFLTDGEEEDLISLLGLDCDIVIDEDDAMFSALSEATKLAEDVSATVRRRFNEVIMNCEEPDTSMKILENKDTRKAFAENLGVRLMATTSAANFVNIDYTLSPEPEYLDSLKEAGCIEWLEWELARKEELKAMSKFGVYRVVKRSEASGRKLLTAKWVHKRKTNEKGEVNRYKARLVARGFAQKEYDSFHPDETFAHVVDRNSLRTILSVAASNNLKVYSFDIRNTYLQAKLKEVIYMEPPPGMKLAKDECLALDRPIWNSTRRENVLGCIR